MRNFSIQENKKLIAAMVFIVFSILFWAFFEQSGGSLSLFAANNLDSDFLGINLDPNGVNNAANSLFVIIFAPLLGLVWVWLNTRKAEPNTVVKFGLGFLFLALAFTRFISQDFLQIIDGMTSVRNIYFGLFHHHIWRTLFIPNRIIDYDQTFTQ